jgi:hypothetical protein
MPHPAARLLPTALLAWGVAVLLAAPVLASDTREFTGTNGQKIQAKLVGHKAGKITLERADGKRFEAAPSVFQVDDQVFIQEWMRTHPETVSYRFNVSATREKVDGSFTNLSYKRVKNERWAYRLKISNLSPDTLTGLTVRYKLLHTNRADGEFSTGSEAPTVEVAEGETKLPAELPFNRALEFLTVPVELDFVDYAGTGSRYKDELFGCLIRILDAGGATVMDWTSPGPEMKDRTWDRPLGQASGPGTAVIR